MTAKGNTRQEILDAALELFSVQGFEATSISQLAEAVGIRKASLYSHFGNKQAILDTLLETTLEEYDRHSIEQFRNPRMARLQTRQNYTGVMGYFTGLMGFLIRQGKLTAHDPEVMAAQFCLPISVWINLCDREPDREAEVMDRIGRHIRQFFALYACRPETGKITENREEST